MSEQSQRGARGSESARQAETEQLTAATDSGSDRTRARDADVDALLDEIDDVLEVNAEEFVRSFVQKGGQ